MNNIAINFGKVWHRGKNYITSKPLCVNLSKIKYEPTFGTINQSYSKASGLRSMQHIQGEEREIIEAYRSELTHNIWGNAEKLKEWVKNKFIELTNKNYHTNLLSETTVQNDRNLAVNEWAEEISSNLDCKRNPFLSLKILKSVIIGLKENNMQLPPIINSKAISEAIHEVKTKGGSFTKTYFKILRDLENSVGAKVEEVNEFGIRGKWYTIKVPNEAEAKRNPGFYKKTQDFISVLSQKSNWCTRTPNTVGKTFSGNTFHIFVDNKGKPQLCLVGANKKRFRFACGNDQYAPIIDKYRPILKSFIERNNMSDASVGLTNAETVNITDLIK